MFGNQHCYRDETGGAVRGKGAALRRRLFRSKPILFWSVFLCGLPCIFCLVPLVFLVIFTPIVSSGAFSSGVGIASFIPTASALEDRDQLQERATILQNLDTQLDLSLTFVDEKGETRALKELFLNNRPVIIAPVYYTCPSLCNLTLNGLLDTLNGLDLKLGEDFSVIAYSIKPEEGPEVAGPKAENYYAKLTNPQAGRAGWRFLTGTRDNIDTLSKQLGFQFFLDETKEYAHAAGLMIITPEGRISRYFFGVMYEPTEMRRALVEASEGVIGSIVDKIFLFCFRYDAMQGKYTPIVMNIMNGVASAGVVVLFLFIAWLRVSEVRKSRNA